MIKIDKNIPLPRVRNYHSKGNPHRDVKYPFENMEVGDSFFISENDYTCDANVRHTLWVGKKRMGTGRDATIRH